jgi:hypothetical protein
MNTLGFGVRMTTSRRLERMENWLDANCTGEWHIKIDGISDDFTSKTVSVMFERASDKKRFRSICRGFS